MIWLLSIALAEDPVQEDDPYGLFRVEDPDHPDAVARSASGSLLLAPPEEGPWTVEEAAHPHDFVGSFEAHEALDAMNIEPWHQAGYLGQGVKVAVFDLQWYGAELRDEELGDYESWDCWAHEGCTPEIDTLRPRFSYETGNHGLACAEVVRDVAPEAELHLVRVNGNTTFENAAEWAVRNEIDVVTLSMSFMNGSFYDGTGSTAKVVETLSEGGVLLVTSAGNYARGHYLDDFRDADGDGIHELADGSQRLPIYLQAGKKRGVTVQWDNYRRCGDTDLDLWLYAEDGSVLDVADAVQDGEDGCSPVERLGANLDEGQWTYLEVHRVRGDPAVRWNLITTSGRVDGSMAESSVTDPGTHPLAWTVGAAAGQGYLTNEVEGFSSWGPNLAGDPKPDIVAPDGVTTSAYGPTGFYGTSASSPAAAAALAVVMSSRPELDAREASELVEGWAVAERSSWHATDNAHGAGYLRLPDPGAELPGCFGRAFGSAALLLFPWTLLRRRRPC